MKSRRFVRGKLACWLICPVFLAALSSTVRSQEQRTGPHGDVLREPVLDEGSLLTKPTGPVYDTTTAAGPNHRWRSVKNDAGEEIGGYVELASGLNRWNPQTGSWDEAETKLEAFEGGALSRLTSFDLILSPSSDDPNGVFDVLLPLMPGQREQDRGRIRGQCVGIAMTDSTGRSVFISEVTDVAGLAIENEVIYPGCFRAERGFSASLRYSVANSGLAQDVILHTALPKPSEMGFEPVRDATSGELVEAPVAIEVWSQLLEAPPATTTREVLPSGEDDIRVSFEGMEFARGTAFPLDTESPNRAALRANGVPVRKDYIQLNGMQFLVESVPYARIAAETANLKPLAEVNRLKQRKRSTALAALDGNRGRVLPLSIDRNQEATDPDRSGFAMKRFGAGKELAIAEGKGYVLDFDIITGTISNQTFYGDTTYYVSGPTTLKETTTLEGGTVCKFKDNTTSLLVDSGGKLVVLTEPYRPAWFVGKDDDLVGEILTNSTHTISNTYAYPALSYTPSAPVNLAYINVRSAKQGIFLNNGTNANVIKHAQFVGCEQGIVANGGGAKVRNVLFSDTTKALVGTNSPFTGEHVTVRGSQYLLADGGGSSLAMTNSIFVNVVNFFASMTGTPNVTNTDPTVVFQEVGAAKHYLKDAYRNAGTTNIDPILASELRSKTTYAPIVINNSVDGDRIWFPTAQRDTDTPDPGYHYEPIDVAANDVFVSNATLTLTNGVSVAVYGWWGVHLDTTAKLVSEGKADQMNRLIRYNVVQEQPIAWTAQTPSGLIRVTGSALVQGDVRLRFTGVSTISGSAGSRKLFDESGGVLINLNLSMKDCQFYNVDQGFRTLWTGASISLTNNLFDGCALSFEQGPSVGTNYVLNVYNNLFRRGTNVFTYKATNTTWTIKDNLFLPVQLTITSGSSNTTAANNAYLNGLSTLGGSSNKTVYVPDFLAGPLGRYYYPLTGTNLVNLVDAGSRAASNATLYHHTITGGPETSSPIDIGFHYVAMPSAAGLVGYWRFDEGTGTNIFDSSGYGHDGSFTGPSWTSGRIGANALSFDGTNDLGSALDSPALRLAGDMTLSLWFKKSAIPSAWAAMVIKPWSAGENWSMWMEGTPGTRVLFEQWDAPNMYVETVSGTTNGGWYHVAATVSGNDLRIYLNGTLDSTATRAHSAPTTTDTVRFGFDQYYGTYYPGILDDIRVYNRTLSAADVATLAAGTVFDTDGDGIPNYIEDVNGNGTVDTGETDWMAYNSLNGLSGSNDLRIYTPLR